MDQRTWRNGLVTSVIGVIALLTVGLWPANTSSGADEDTATPPPTTTTVVEDENCPTWATAEADHANNRWFANGIREIREAETPDEAREAAHTWLDQVKRHPKLLSAAAKYFFDRDVDPASLEEEGCATEEASVLVSEIELALGEAEIQPEAAPADGYNSGVDADGDVVAASHAGITGDRHAIKVILKDGTTVWVMARCGNPVTREKPKVPEGPTDEPPPEEPPPCPPRTHREGDDCIHDSVGDNPDPLTPRRQSPQENPGQPVGPTPVAPEEPTTPPPGPTPQEGTEAPPPNQDGYDSGTDDGSGTPGGTDCGPSGCSGGGSSPPPNPPEDSGQGGDNSEEVDQPSW